MNTRSRAYKKEHAKRTHSPTVVNHRRGRNYCVIAGCSKEHKK